MSHGREFGPLRSKLVRPVRNATIEARALIADQPYLAHVGLHQPQNAGDTLLFTSVRETFDAILGRHRWSLAPLRTPVADRHVQRWNARAAAVVVGGGGLLLPDTNRNDRSGWQWDISSSQLRRLQSPLVAFAIGYNRFRGQEGFPAVFDDHIRATVEKSIFTGLRNSGSIRSLAEHLPTHLRSRLQFQPCTTTLLGLLEPEMDGQGRGGDILAVNLAFDRPALRFPEGAAGPRRAIVAALTAAGRQGWRVHYYRHHPADDDGLAWLVDAGLSPQIVDLYRAPASRVAREYARATVTIGMRGHSQLVPFGLGNRIISVVSHDKMRWFLEDVGRPEWGADVDDPDLDERLMKLLDADADATLQQLLAARQRFWETTVDNVRSLESVMFPARDR